RRGRIRRRGVHRRGSRSWLRLRAWFASALLHADGDAQGDHRGMADERSLDGTTDIRGRFGATDPLEGELVTAILGVRGYSEASSHLACIVGPDEAQRPSGLVPRQHVDRI